MIQTKKLLLCLGCKMQVLLDTHVILWAITDDKRLSDKAREIILNPKNELFYSVISMWEVALKYSLKKNMPVSEDEFLVYCENAGFNQIPLNQTHISTLKTLNLKNPDNPHKDPFDNMLLSQAKSEGMTLLTHDTSFSAYNEPYYFLV